MYIQDTGYVSFHGRYAKITQRSFKLINHFIQAHKSLFLEMSVVGEKLPEKLPETETEPGMKQRRYEEEKENMKTKKMKIKGLRCRGLGPSVGEDVGSNFGFGFVNQLGQLNKINPDIGEDAEQESHEEAFVREYIAYTAVVEPAHVVNAVDVNPSDLQSIENIIKQVVHVSHKKAIAYADAHLRDTFVGELVDRICGVLDGDAFDLSDRCKLERYVRRFTPENGMQEAFRTALGQAEKPPGGGNLGCYKAGQFVSALIAAVGDAEEQERKVA